MNRITNYREESYDAEHGCWPPSACKPLEPGVMRVLYINGVPDCCEYLCPCGCGSPCPTFFPSNGKRQRTPSRHLWDFSKGPTLSPSIRHLSGCKSHYNITNGNVVWHADSGR